MGLGLDVLLPAHRDSPSIGRPDGARCPKASSAIDPSMLEFGMGPDGWSFTRRCCRIGLAWSLIGLGFLGSPQIFVRFIALARVPRRRSTRVPTVAIGWTLLADVGAVMTGMIGATRS